MATMTETTLTQLASPKAIEVETDELDSFHQLVRDLSDVLGPSSGLDSDDINVEEIEKLLCSYRSTTSEWQKYALADYTRPYTRNLVDKGNGKSNLVSRILAANPFALSLTRNQAHPCVDSW